MRIFSPVHKATEKFLYVFVFAVLLVAYCSLLTASTLYAAEDHQVDWTDQFGSVTGNIDNDYATAVGNDGSAYVVGGVEGSLPGFTNQGFLDVFIRKYSKDGVLLWTYQYGTNADDEPASVAVSGNDVFIVGFTEGTFAGETSSGGFDYFVTRLDTDGTHIWTHQYGTASSDEANAVSVIPTGEAAGVYVAGSTSGSFPGETNAGNGDGFLAKLTTAGTVSWTQQYGSVALEESSGMAASEDTLYIVGYTSGQVGSDTHVGAADGYLAAYTSTGTQLWIRQFGTTLSEATYGVARAGDKLYIVGTTWGTFPGKQLSGTSDAFLLQYTTAGTHVWTKQFGTAGADQMLGVSAESNSNSASDVLVAGYTNGTYAGQTQTGPTDVVVQKYTSDGTLAWTEQYGSTGTDYVNGISAGDDGAFVVGLTLGSFPGHTSSGYLDAFVTHIAIGPDYDQDSIANNVDVDPVDYSDEYSDGTTTGYIATRGTQILTIEDAVDEADGVVVSAALEGSATTSAVVEACGGDVTYTLTPGDSFIVTCGSVITTVDIGPVDALFTATDNSTITSALPANTTSTFKSDVKVMTADPINSVAIVVVQDGISYTIEPGEAEGFGDDAVGPQTSAISVSPNPIPLNVTSLLTATVDDTYSGTSTIQSAYFAVDGTGTTSMTTNDEAFNSVLEITEGVVPAYAATGVHEVCVWGIDNRGNAGAQECILIAVYDPSSGYVTGGGRVASPLGAVAADTTLAGHAVFAFTSRYHQGAQLPSGHTQFRFKIADIGFRSADYDWLVVAGARAQFKGTGKINNAGNYGFLLTGIDGARPGGGGSDKFRIKIWDKDNNDLVVYDNNMGDADTGDPTTVITAGNIIIHNK